MENIRVWLKENQITEVECLVPDMTGNARGKFIPADKFIKEDSRLPESILVDVHSCHMGTTESKEPGHGPADPGGRAGDDRHFSPQILMGGRHLKNPAPAGRCGRPSG